jgi:hypothetical protein
MREAAEILARMPIRITKNKKQGKEIQKGGVIIIVC